MIKNESRIRTLLFTKIRYTEKIFLILSKFGCLGLELRILKYTYKISVSVALT